LGPLDASGYALSPDERLSAKPNVDLWSA